MFRSALFRLTGITVFAGWLGRAVSGPIGLLPWLAVRERRDRKVAAPVG